MTKKTTQGGFASIKKGKEEKKKTTAPVQEVKKTVIKPVVKTGRPSSKDPNVEYVKFGGWIKESTKIRMQMALLTTCKGVHKTQEEIVEAAINAYLDNFEK